MTDGDGRRRRPDFRNKGGNKMDVCSEAARATGRKLEMFPDKKHQRGSIEGKVMWSILADKLWSKLKFIDVKEI